MNIHRTQRRVWSTLALALVTGIVAAGCGSDSGPGDGANSKSNSASAGAATPDTKKDDETQASADACGIVSDDVAAEVLGVRIVRREPHGKPGSQSVGCIKGTERSNDLETNSYVSASVITEGRDVADQAASEKGSKPVSGLGDRAHFLPSAGALFIIDGDDLVQVQVVKVGKPGSQQECVTVAKDVLSKRG